MCTSAKPSAMRKRGGFLLIELVLALAVLVLVSLGVYKIIQATLESASEIRRNHRTTQEIQGMIELTRRAMRNLPGNAEITNRTTADGGRYFPELVLDKAPAAFALGPAALHYGPQVLAIRPQIGGLFQFVLIFEPELSATGEPVDDTPSRSLRLLGDVRSLEWRFFDPRTSRWVEKWEETTARPRLVRMLLGIAGHENPFVATFALPDRGDMPSLTGRRQGARSTQDSDGDNNGSPPPATTPGATPPPVSVTQ